MAIVESGAVSATSFHVAASVLSLHVSAISLGPHSSVSFGGSFFPVLSMGLARMERLALANNK